ncbi:hypothetical protein [Halorubrum sodomense]|uniref:Uncharacterized protein n=1 Tax=Halorubrum sodomense TaxID=35743 RepID=A0A1I6FMJ6_HALSD|nr:hypothetical protein [Halorubrum sodomense]SFR31173.1 hypothetical protein SAMN04487937_1014 [Halorubrum sodomense]
MNIKKTGLAALLALAVLTSMAVPAMAQSGTELADKSVTVDGDTESVYLEVTNSSGDALNYTVYGISDGLSTQVDSGTISATANDTVRQEFAVNATEYSSYRVVVTEDASDTDSESAENIEIGTTVNQTSGGGGVFAGVGGGLFSLRNGLIAVVIGGGAYVLGFLDPVKNRLEG